MTLLGKKKLGPFPYDNLWYPPGGEVVVDDEMIQAIKKEDFEHVALTKYLSGLILTHFNIDMKNITSLVPAIRKTMRVAKIPNEQNVPEKYTFIEYHSDYKGRANIPSALYAETRWARIPELATFPMVDAARELFTDVGLLK